MNLMHFQCRTNTCTKFGNNIKSDILLPTNKNTEQGNKDLFLENF